LKKNLRTQGRQPEESPAFLASKKPNSQKSEFSQIPFSVFRILLSGTAVIRKGCVATEESPEI